MIKYFLAFVIIISITSSASALQNNPLLQFKVVDSKTGAPVPYASITINEGNSGTAANEEGLFFIRRDDLKDKGIKISSVGYIPKTVTLTELISAGETLTVITLVEEILMLEEVTVRESLPDPREIINEAVKNIPKNYRQVPFNMNLYSKISVLDSVQVRYSVESILLTYRKGYVAGGVNLSKVVKKRENGNNPIKPMEDKKTKRKYFHHYPGFDVALIDQVGGGSSYHYSIFNEEKIKKMKLKYAGVKLYDKDTVCVIQYSLDDYNSKNQKANGLSGEILIALNNYAIVKHTIFVGTGEFEIIYKRMKDVYYPYFMKSVFTMNGSQKRYKVKNEIIVMKINTDEIVTVENSPKYWYPEDVAYNQQYWESTFPEKTND